MTKKEVTPLFREDMLLLFSKIWGFYYLFEPYYGGLEDVTVRGKWADFAMLCEPDFELHLEEILKTLVRHDLHKQTADFKRCITCIRALRHTLQLLADDPIMADSGHIEPIYDKPRMYSDVQNEIATRLANPQAFTAYCKLGNREYTIQALPLQNTDSRAVVMARREHIVTQTRSRYCKKRTDVEAEIAARQEKLLKPEKKVQKTKQEE